MRPNITTCVGGVVIQAFDDNGQERVYPVPNKISAGKTAKDRYMGVYIAIRRPALHECAGYLIDDLDCAGARQGYMIGPSQRLEEAVAMLVARRRRRAYLVRPADNDAGSLTRRSEQEEDQSSL